jgi:hypothetical protein
MTEQEKHFKLYDQVVQIPGGIEFLQDVNQAVKQNQQYRKAIKDLLIWTGMQRDLLKANSVYFPGLREQIADIEDSINNAKATLNQTVYNP